MLGISWGKLVVGVVITGIVAITVLYIVGIIGADSANKKAAGTVAAVTTEAKTKGAAEAEKIDEKGSARVEVVRRRSAASVSRIVGASNPDRAFFDGVCVEELYAADPQCVGRGGIGGRAGTPRE